VTDVAARVSSPASDTAQTPKASDHAAFGIAYVASPVGAVVISVTKSSPAESAGLVAGDIIEAVDGISLKAMPEGGIKAVIAGRGSQFRLSVLGKGAVIVKLPAG